MNAFDKRVWFAIPLKSDPEVYGENYDRIFGAKNLRDTSDQGRDADGDQCRDRILPSDGKREDSHQP